METNLLLQRSIYTDRSTIGDLYIGEEFECNTLEDTCRHRAGDDNILQTWEKIPGETAIPAGRYEIKMEWSQRYQRLMPFLQNVPFFDGIMIHWGNTDKNTRGCILTGQRDPGTPDWISKSQDAYNELEPKILAAMKVGPVFIHIVGGYSV